MAGTAGSLVGTLTRDGKPIPPPEKYTIRIVIESPDGTLSNVLEDVLRADLLARDYALIGIGAMLRAMEHSVYGHGDPPPGLACMWLQVIPPSE